MSRRPNGDAASAPGAAAAQGHWRAIDAQLAGIIGPRGVAALYERSLEKAGVRHPWLAAAATDADAAADPYAALQRVLAEQPAAQAQAASDQLLSAFKDLLTRLIGSALAERLLVEVWPTLHSGPAAQDHDR